MGDEVQKNIDVLNQCANGNCRKCPYYYYPCLSHTNNDAAIDDLENLSANILVLLAEKEIHVSAYENVEVKK